MMRALLDLPGPAFLSVYVMLLTVATMVAVVLRRTLRGRRTNLDSRFLSLRPVEMGYLAGAQHQAFNATLAALAQRELIAADVKHDRLQAVGSLPPGLDPIEQAVHRLVRHSDGRITNLRRAVEPLFEPARVRLEKLGLLEAPQSLIRLRVVPAAIVGCIVVLGVAKIGVGMGRDRPVGFLIILTVLAAALAVGMLLAPPWRSRTGDSVLASFKARYAALGMTARSESRRVTPEDLSLAVALYGPAVLVAGQHAPLGRLLVPPVTTGGTRSSGSSCSSCSSGCGGGGGGCGGCGD